MQLLISFWISCSILIYSQSECKNFDTIFDKIDEHYSEPSRNYFPDFIKFHAFNSDSVNIDLYNVDGKLVYQKFYIVDSTGKFILKFFNPDCPGIYFCSVKVGKLPSTKIAIQITDKSFPTGEDTTNNY